MPGHNEHCVIGAIVASVVFYLVHHFQIVSTTLGSVDWIILIGIAYIYCLLPDIDQDSSIINKYWNTTAGLAGLYSLYTQKYVAFGIFAIASIVILEWTKHRGITHEEWFGICMAAPLWLVNPLFAIIAASAYMSHIFADGDVLR